MSDNKNLSITYRLLRKIGFNYPEEEYGQISPWVVIKRVYKTYRDSFLMNCIMDSWLLSPFAPRKVRPWVLRIIGCHVGKDVFIGSQVWVDSGHADLIYIGDRTHITARTVLLCHKKDLSDYHKGDDYAKLAYMKGEIHIGKGCSTGTGTMIMPGVTIGDGSIIGAYSLVTKDIPAWSIAIGRPAKVVKQITQLETDTIISETNISDEHTDF